MTGAGGQREHLAVGPCSHGHIRSVRSAEVNNEKPLLHLVSLVIVHLIFPMARDLKEASDTAVTAGLVTSLMVQMLRVKL